MNIAVSAVQTDNSSAVAIIGAYKEIANGTLSLRDYLASFRTRLAFANFALDDPMPAIAELPVAAWKRLAPGSAK
jgi:predicted ATP-grasp superfamily ATP-dependent carboligase